MLAFPQQEVIPRVAYCSQLRLAAGLLLLAGSALAQHVRIIRFADSKPFQMGTVTSRRIVHPDMGAKLTTLNLSVSQAGSEFAQHVHDNSDDTILVLQGEVDLRQGDSRTPFRTGDVAFVPAGQIHGTITTGPGDNTMISFQTPPDFVLYTGARDSSKPGAAPPKGIITPGAVKYLKFNAKNGFFTHAGMGSLKGAGAHHRLKSGEKFTSELKADGERVLFVWRGAVSIAANGGIQNAGEKDTAFVAGPGRLVVTADSDDTVVIEIHAPASAPAALRSAK